jgi:hypothetical protein
MTALLSILRREDRLDPGIGNVNGAPSDASHEW